MVARPGECGWTVAAVEEEPFQLWRRAMLWSRLVDEALRPIGLTHTQFLLLAATAAETAIVCDAVHQGAIARRAGVDKVTASRVLLALERRGFVDRGEDGYDVRRYSIYLGNKGAKKLEEARGLVAEARKKFESTTLHRPTVSESRRQWQTALRARESWKTSGGPEKGRWQD